MKFKIKIIKKTFYILLKYIKHRSLDRPLKNRMDAWHHVGAIISQIVNGMV